MENQEDLVVIPRADLKKFVKVVDELLKCADLSHAANVVGYTPEDRKKMGDALWNFTGNRKEWVSAINHGELNCGEGNESLWCQTDFFQALTNHILLFVGPVFALYDDVYDFSRVVANSLDDVCMYKKVNPNSSTERPLTFLFIDIFYSFHHVTLTVRGAIHRFIIEFKLHSGRQKHEEGVQGKVCVGILRMFLAFLLQ